MRRSARERVFSNKRIPAGIVTELAVILPIDYTEAGNAIFGTAPLPWRALAVVVPIAIGMLLLEEWRKLIIRRQETATATAFAR